MSLNAQFALSGVLHSVSVTVVAAMLLSVLLPSTAMQAAEKTGNKCSDYRPGQRNLYWGDLHVHSSFSLDAYAFGTTADPGDAFAFARGQELTWPDKTSRTRLARPLDFAAVTDHAETFDVMYLCTDPIFSSEPYCQQLREGSGTNSEKSGGVFRSFLLPLIAGEKPTTSPLCEQEGLDCDDASQRQWQRSQQYANAANSQCEFTAFIGNEWSATPNNQHWHRNLIYSGSAVSRQAIDYLRYPSPEKMWGALEDQCDPTVGCNVIAIPHNTNLSEGGGFDVETGNRKQLRLRAKYERLIEIYQSKGNSECLAENWDDLDSDCGFEILLPPRAKREVAKRDSAYISQLNRSYARKLLGRGLLAYKRSEERELNPLQLGFVGSTDGHVGMPGAVEETSWKGDAWGGGDQFKQRQLKRKYYSPGGLVAVWAEENTRASLFSALSNRQTYATSGTRIQLNFKADRSVKQHNACKPTDASAQLTSMGGTIKDKLETSPIFSVTAAQDLVPLARIEIVRGTLKDGQLVETVFRAKADNQGFSHSCTSWSDSGFDGTQPTYWYARVLEVPTPRWSKLLCEELSDCKQEPFADQMIQERAWSSAIWYLP